MAAVRTVTRSLTLDAPPERVWPAVADSDCLARWMGVGLDVELQPAAVGTAQTANGPRHMRVEAVEPHRRLVFVWWPTGQAPPTGAPPSVVEISLAGAGQGSKMTVTETALADSPHRDLLLETAGR